MPWTSPRKARRWARAWQWTRLSVAISRTPIHSTTVVRSGSASHGTGFGAKYDAMDAFRDVEPVTTLKREASELIERARERQSPILITQNGRATAVLQDIESFERQRRILTMLRLLAQGERDYETGRTLTPAQARKRFQAVLEDRTEHGK
jgi:prevent-host-death family protein